MSALVGWLSPKTIVEHNFFFLSPLLCILFFSNLYFYFTFRAPEIILGLKYDTPIDLWSIGATIYEIASGKIMFPGHSNNQMLKLFMELKGKIPNKLIRKGQFRLNHFDDSCNFTSHEIDKVTQRDKVTVMPVINKSRSISQELCEP